jgi:peptidoglycan/xylan/chitin deacetylase (PgdA/CDA1 family)
MPLSQARLELVPKRFIGSLFLLAVIAVSLLSPLAAVADDGVTVILYHRVGDERYPSTNVTLDGFRQQLAYLGEAGYTVVSTADLEGYLLRGKSLPPKAVAIQFDDGFRSVFENAFPILKEFGYTFTVFLPTEAIEKGYGDYVSWEMVAEMAGAGAEIASHSHTHPRLGTVSKGQSPEDYSRQIADEIARSAALLKKHGYPTNWLAYPYGEYNKQLMAATRDAGYALGFAQDPGAIGSGHDPYALPRFAVVGATSDFKVFKERLGYRPLVMAEKNPDVGVLESSAPGVFRARVADPTLYYSGEVNLFVSELGRMEATYDSSTGWITAESDKPLTRRLNRVLVSLRAKAGGFALTSWSLIRKP